jgi:hypothetical protein
VIEMGLVCPAIAIAGRKLRELEALKSALRSASRRFQRLTLGPVARLLSALATDRQNVFWAVNSRGL